jgi:hypothetical protein
MNGREIWWRALLLALWAAASCLWLERHFGIGVSDPLALVGLTGLPTLVFLVLDRVLGSEEIEGLKSSLDKWTRGLLRQTLLSTPVLVLLYLSGAMFAATYTSITVVPPREAKSLGVRAVPIGAGGAPVVAEVQAGGAPARLRLPASPFGRDVTLSITGYVPKTMTLYPLTGSTVDPEADLQPMPTVLFRPSIDSLASLAEGGAVNVYRMTSAGCQLLGSIKGREAGFAVLVGPDRPIPAGSSVLWQLELEASAVDKTILASALRDWAPSHHTPGKVAGTRRPYLCHRSEQGRQTQGRGTRDG